MRAMPTAVRAASSLSALAAPRRAAHTMRAASQRHRGRQLRHSATEYTRLSRGPYRGVYAVTLTAADTRYVGDAAQVRLAWCVPLALAPVAHRDRRDDCARWRVRALLQRCRVSLTPHAIDTTEITSCRMGYRATSSVLPRAAQRRPTGAAAVEGLLYSWLVSRGPVGSGPSRLLRWYTLVPCLASSTLC